VAFDGDPDAGEEDWDLIDAGFGGDGVALAMVSAAVTARLKFAARVWRWVVTILVVRPSGSRIWASVLFPSSRGGTV